MHCATWLRLRRLCWIQASTLPRCHAPCTSAAGSGKGPKGSAAYLGLIAQCLEGHWVWNREGQEVEVEAALGKLEIDAHILKTS